MPGKKAKDKATASSSSLTNEPLAISLAPIFAASADRGRSSSKLPCTNTSLLSAQPIIINTLSSVKEFTSLLMEVRKEVDQLHDLYKQMTEFSNTKLADTETTDARSGRIDSIYQKLASHSVTPTQTSTNSATLTTHPPLIHRTELDDRCIV